LTCEGRIPHEVEQVIEPALPVGACSLMQIRLAVNRCGQSGNNQVMITTTTAAMLRKT